MLLQLQRASRRLCQIKQRIQGRVVPGPLTGLELSAVVKMSDYFVIKNLALSSELSHSFPLITVFGYKMPNGMGIYESTRTSDVAQALFGGLEHHLCAFPSLLELDGRLSDCNHYIDVALRCELYKTAKRKHGITEALRKRARNKKMVSRLVRMRESIRRAKRDRRAYRKSLYCIGMRLMSLARKSLKALHQRMVEVDVLRVLGPVVGTEQFAGLPEFLRRNNCPVPAWLQ